MESCIEMSQTSLHQYFKSTHPQSDGISKGGKKSTPRKPQMTPVKSRKRDSLRSDAVSENGNRKRTVSQHNRSPSSRRKRHEKSPATAAVRRMRSQGPRRTLHFEGVDTGKVSNMVENLNLTRTGILARNHFCLVDIYSSHDETEPFSCTGNYRRDTDDFRTVYDIGGVVVPSDESAEHLFNVFAEVFSNRVNCGYFDDEELDLIFTYLTLSEKAQMLFVRMIKRKRQWRRSSSVAYLEIDADLKPHFDELEALGFYTSDISRLDLATMLGMLKADEVRDVCLRLKLPWKNNKTTAVENLLKINTTKSLFPGVESPGERLRNIVVKSLGNCVCLREEAISLVDRIVTLFTPWEEISATLGDVFLKLAEIKKGTMRYPETPVKYYPRFRDRDHLIRYVEWKNKWRHVDGLVKTNPANWETLVNTGREAYSRFAHLLAENSDRNVAAIPRHVINYSEEYVCAKLITICLEVFKKEKSLVPKAIEMLSCLIEQRSYLQSKKGVWYEELALIETKHNKNLEAAAAATVAGLSLDNLTDSARINLSKRAKGLLRRRSGLTSQARSRLDDLIAEQPTAKSPRVVVVDANAMEVNWSGKKSTWCIDMGNGDKSYTSVEGRASHYYEQIGYAYSWHCEGSLPLTLFTLLMWEEIYTVPVTAAYLSPHQKAPLDLYTSEFYANRKVFIDKKIERITAMSSEELAIAVETSLEKWKGYESLMPNSLPVGNESMKDLVKCMGTAVVAGICKRMASNFVGYRAGFPDLVVWNPRKMKCKIVEVKGPGDSLSARQILWLGYLDELGADTELCEVKNVTKSQTRMHASG